MLYLQEILDVQPGMVDEYMDACATHLITGWNRYVTTTGFFKNAFRHREALALWELGEEAGNIDGLGGFILTDLDGKAWQRLALKYRQDWYDSWLEAVPFSPTVAMIKERQKQGDFTGNTLYYRLIFNVLPGKTDEFLEAMQKELVPAAERHGMKLAGCYLWFGACGESGEIISLWSRKDWAHWGRIREAQRNEPEFQRWSKKQASLCAGWSYKFLLPAPYSLLH